MLFLRRVIGLHLLLFPNNSLRKQKGGEPVSKKHSDRSQKKQVKVISEEVSTQSNWIFQDPKTKSLFWIHVRTNPFSALVVTEMDLRSSFDGEIYCMSLRTMDRVVQNRNSFKCYDDKGRPIPITVTAVNQKEHKVTIQFDEGTQVHPCNPST